MVPVGLVLIYVATICNGRDAMQQQQEGGQPRNVLLFSVGKNEEFSPTNGYKNLTRKLRNSWKIGTYVAAVAVE